MFKKIVVMMLLLGSFNACADELWVDFNLHAHHFNRKDVAEQNLNEVNPGIGLRFVDGEYHKMIGVYKNSDRKTSAYALMAWTPIGAGSIRIGAFGGVVTGYEKPYLPVAGLTAIVSITKKVNVNLVAVPTVRKMNCYGFLGIQFGVKL